MYSRICEFALRRPEKTAIIYADQLINYATFAGCITSAIKFLSQFDVAAGSTVAVIARNIAHAWFVGIAARAKGLHTISARSLAEIPRNIGVSAVLRVESDGEVASGCGDEFEKLPQISFPSLWRTIKEFDASDVNLGHLECGDHLLFTSGTTGSGKGVVLSGEQEDLRNAFRAATLGLDESSIFHGMSFGVWTGAGYKQPSAVWHVGGTVIFDQRSNQLFNYAAKESDQVALLPADILQLMKSPQAGDLKPSDTLISLSSGFVTKRMMEFIRARMSRNIILRYSATELIDVPLSRRDDGGDDFHWLDVAPGCVVEIVDAQGDVVPVDVEGTLRIRLKAYDPQGYLGDDRASAAVFRDGCFYPGDMAVRRPDGRVRIVGRVVDVINLHGHKWAVAPLEALIQDELSAEDVCLFIHNTAEGDEEMIVAVQSQVRPSEGAVERIKARFSGIDRLRVETMAEFPRSDSGTRKVQRSVLKAMLTAK
ncbi:AMP-binding protein [Caulobacter henricii]|uniref:AMP-binding protein n=1 Tax=Caulobacter henricii TaxID=69395 RepID=UPI001412A11E|nr:class I adenylate-forming enzyme family protein [Caulobacter henricii]